jgi:hypothetical protein
MVWAVGNARVEPKAYVILGDEAGVRFGRSIR